MNTREPIASVADILLAVTTNAPTAHATPPDYANWAKFVYLLHFTKKRAHAQHYLGASYQLFERLHRHADGRGAAITRALWHDDEDWTLAALFVPKPRCSRSIFELETQAKRRHSSRDYCPLCLKQNLAPAGMMQYPIPFPISAADLRCKST